jgi:A/G-specific adenine glycosylase
LSGFPDPSQNLPARRPDLKSIQARRVRLVRQFLIFKYDDQVILYQRPEQSVWGGLWAFPHEDLNHNQNLSATHLSVPHQLIKILSQKHDLSETKILSINFLKSFEHIFTHFTLCLEPIVIQLKSSVNGPFNLNQKSEYLLTWVSIKDLINRQWALPKPIEKIIKII